MESHEINLSMLSLDSTAGLADAPASAVITDAKSHL
jgi:hypothetical protein